MKLSRKPDCVLSDIKKQLLAITDIDSKCAKELEGVHFIRWEEGDEYGTRKFGSLITKAAVFLIVSGGLKLLFCGEEKVYGPGDLFLPVHYEPADESLYCHKGRCQCADGIPGSCGARRIRS